MSERLEAFKASNAPSALSQWSQSGGNTLLPGDRYARLLPSSIKIYTTDKFIRLCLLTTKSPWKVDQFGSVP